MISFFSPSLMPGIIRINAAKPKIAFKHIFLFFIFPSLFRFIMTGYDKDMLYMNLISENGWVYYAPIV